MNVLRMSRSLLLSSVAMLALSSCATRHPQAAETPVVPISRTVVWRVAEGDLIRWKVWREPDLSSESVVGTDGSIYCIGLGRVPVAGLTLDSLKIVIADRYAKMIIEPAVDVSLLRDVVVYGGTRSLGLILADPGMTVIALLSKAGISGGETPIITLIKGDGRKYMMPRDARLGSIELEHADAVYVVDSDFLVRNSNRFVGIQYTVGTISSVLGLVLILIK